MEVWFFGGGVWLFCREFPLVEGFFPRYGINRKSRGGDIAGSEFDYRIPAHLQDSIRVGSQVEVPFKSRELRGFVVGLANHSAFADKLKEIAGVVGDKPLIPDPIMKLAYWIADYYCAPIEAAVRTVLPSAVRKRGARHKKQLFVSLNVDGASSSVRDERKTLIDPLLAQAESTRSPQPNGAGCSVYDTLPPKQKRVIETLQQHGAMTLEGGKS